MALFKTQLGSEASFFHMWYTVRVLVYVCLFLLQFIDLMLNSVQTINKHFKSCISEVASNRNCPSKHYYVWLYDGENVEL